MTPFCLITCLLLVAPNPPYVVNASGVRLRESPAANGAEVSRVFLGDEVVEIEPASGDALWRHVRDSANHAGFMMANLLLPLDPANAETTLMRIVKARQDQTNLSRAERSDYLQFLTRLAWQLGTAAHRRVVENERIRVARGLIAEEPVESWRSEMLAAWRRGDPGGDLGPMLEAWLNGKPRLAASPKPASLAKDLDKNLRARVGEKMEAGLTGLGYMGEIAELENLTQADFDGDGTPEIFFTFKEGYGIYRPSTDEIFADLFPGGEAPCAAKPRFEPISPLEPVTSWPTGCTRLDGCAESLAQSMRISQMRLWQPGYVARLRIVWAGPSCESATVDVQTEGTVFTRAAASTMRVPDGIKLLVANAHAPHLYLGDVETAHSRFVWSQGTDEFKVNSAPLMPDESPRGGPSSWRAYPLSAPLAPRRCNLNGFNLITRLDTFEDDDETWPVHCGSQGLHARLDCTPGLKPMLGPQAVVAPEPHAPLQVFTVLAKRPPGKLPKPDVLSMFRGEIEKQSTPGLPLKQHWLRPIYWASGKERMLSQVVHVFQKDETEERCTDEDTGVHEAYRVLSRWVGASAEWKIVATGEAPYELDLRSVVRDGERFLLVYDDTESAWMLDASTGTELDRAVYHKFCGCTC